MKLDVGVLHLKRPLSTIVPSAREDRYISTSLFCPFLSVRCHFMLNPLQDTCQGEARCLQHCCVCCFEPVEPANMDPSPRVPPSQRLPWPPGNDHRCSAPLSLSLVPRVTRASRCGAAIPSTGTTIGMTISSCHFNINH